MAVVLDCRTPTIVVVGYWNNAIIDQPAWIAQHIVGLAHDVEIELQSIVAGDNDGPKKQIWAFEKFGVSSSPKRVELFQRNVDEENPLGDVISSLARKLPHTPVEAIGVNFHFVVDGDVSAEVPLLETEEPLGAIGQIFSQDRTDRFRLANELWLETEGFQKRETTLSITRKTDFNKIEIDFNYHQPIESAELLALWATLNPVEHWKKHATEVLSEAYGIEKFTHIFF